MITYKEFSPEVREKLEQIKEIWQKIELLNFLIEAVKKSEDWDIDQKTFKDAEISLAKLVNELIEWKIDPQQANKDILKIFLDVFGNGATTYDLKQAFATQKWEKLRMEVLNFVREDLDQYDMVAENILEKNFDLTKLSPEFIKELEKAVRTNSTYTIQSLIESNNEIKSWLKKNKIKIKDFADKLSDTVTKLNEAKSKINIEELAKKYGIKPKDLEERLNQKIIDVSVRWMLFDQFVDAITDNRWKVINRSNYTKAQVEELNLYSDIKGFGIWNLSDKTEDIVWELAELAAIEVAAMAVWAFTAWLWTAALESLAAARWARAWYKIVEWAEDLSKLERFSSVVEIWWDAYKVGKGTKLLYSTGKLGLEWTLFYEWTNFVQNFFEWRDLFEGAGDTKEILKSIVMVGVLKGLDKLFKVIPWLKNLQVKEGENLLKKTFKVSGQIVIEWISLWAIWWTLDVMLDGGERTPEMFLEWIIMAAMFRWMWALGEGVRRVRLRKKAHEVVLEKAIVVEKTFTNGSSDYYSTWHKEDINVVVNKTKVELEKLKDIIKGSSWKQARKNYFSFLKEKRPDKYNEVIKLSKTLSKKDLEKINKYDTIVVTPMYVGETRESISNYLESLSSQKNKNFSVFVYLNWSKEKFSEEHMKKMKKLILYLAKEKWLDDRLVILSKLYDKKPKLSDVRADMMDVLSLSYKKRKNPIIIWLDADTKWLNKFTNKDYISIIKNDLKNNQGIVWVRWDIRYNSDEPALSIIDAMYQLNIRKSLRDWYFVFSWASNNFRLKDYYTVWWYRTFTMSGIGLWEDLMIGSRLKTIWDLKYNSSAKVSTDGSRAVKVINNWKWIDAQWDSSAWQSYEGRNELVNYKIWNNLVSRINDILIKLEKWENVSDKDISKLEEFINVQWKENYWMSDSYVRWWNMFVQPKVWLKMVKLWDKIKLVR